MTRDQVEGRRIWAALRKHGEKEAQQRFHPPAPYVRCDLWLLAEDVQRLNELCTALDAASVRRIPRAAVARHLITRAIRLCHDAAQPTKRAG